MTTQKRIIVARYAVIFACSAFVAVAGVPGLAFKLWRERRRPSEEWRKDQEMYELLEFTEDAHAGCKKEIERLHSALKWTTAPPTKPGWYWVRWGERFEKAGSVECFWIWQERGAWRYGEGAEIAFMAEPHFDLWAGPIEAPPLLELPEEVPTK